MDEYGSMRPCAEDWSHIAAVLRMNGIMSFAYAGDNETAFIITIAGPIRAVGVMPWGGRISGTYLVSLRRLGAEYFDLRDRKKELHPNYIAEKLDLPDSDAEIIATLLNEVSARLGNENSF